MAIPTWSNIKDTRPFCPVKKKEENWTVANQARWGIPGETENQREIKSENSASNYRYL